MKTGEPLAVIYANEYDKLEAAKARFLKAYTINSAAVAKKPLIKGIVNA